MSLPIVQLTPEMRASSVESPFGDGTNNSNVLYCAISTTAASFTMPKSWHGCFIVMKVIGADAYWFFSEQTSVKPDASKTAADPQLGWRTRDGEVVTEYVPRPLTQDGDVYFLVDGSGAGVVWLHKASPQ